MKTYHIPQTELSVSRLAYGCMKIGGSWGPEPLTQAVHGQALQRDAPVARRIDAFRKGGQEVLKEESGHQVE